jgi:hypothetical protein
MSVSNLYAVGVSGAKFIKQDRIEVDNLRVDKTLIVNGTTEYDGGIVVNGFNDPTKEIVMNINDDVFDTIGDTTGINFEVQTGSGPIFNSQSLGSVVCENSSAVAGSVVASKIAVKPAIPNGATPVISEMLCVGKDLLTTEVGVLARSAFGAGLDANLGITNIEDYASASTGKVYKFNLPSAGGSDVLTLEASQIAPSGGAGSPPSVLSTKVLMTIAPDGPAGNPTSYGVAIGDITDASPLVTVQGSSGNGIVYDTRYNPIGGPFVGIGGSSFQLLTSASPITSTYTPTKTGLHAFSFQIQLNSIATIATGATDRIDCSFALSSGSPTTTTFLASTINYLASATNEYTFNGINYLTAGTPYTLTVTAWGAGWSVPVYAQIAPIC